MLVVATVLLTVTQLEPLNAIANSWDPDRLPGDWAATLETWLWWHRVRVVLAVAAFGSLLACQVLDTAEPVGRRGRPSTVNARQTVASQLP